MKFDDNWRVALHEAGHAFTAHVLPRTFLNKTTMDATDFGPKETYSIKTIDDIVKTYLAGKLTEELFFGDSVGGNHDNIQIEKLIRDPVDYKTISHLKTFLHSYKEHIFTIAQDLMNGEIVYPQRIDEIFIQMRRNGYHQLFQ
jgi:hypothetical protein